jgi:hypothetical protein
MTTKAVRVLHILMEGGRIEHSGRRWVMSDDNRLCVVAHNETEDTEVLLPILDDSFSGFIGWAESLPEEVIFLAAAGVTLTRIRRM